jgi:phi13 family phage major tail protein
VSAAPVAIPGAVKLSRDPQMEEITITPNIVGAPTEYTVGYRDKGIKLDLEIVNLPLSFLTDVLGYTVTSSGILIENEHPLVHFALLYENQNTDGTAVRHSYPDCVCEKPKFDVTTLSNNFSIDTKKLNIIANKDIFGSGCYKKSITAEQNATIYNNWFNQVY